jgi:serine/threonine protein kinase
MPASLCPFARQRIGARVGSGVYGVAYRLQVGRNEYIVKEQPLTEGDNLRVAPILEAAVLASISHPNIVALMEVCVQGERLQLVEEVGGSTLREWMESQREAEAYAALAALAAQAECAVRFLHECGIYHNDLSANNILVDEHGHLLLIDFGLATIGAPEGISDDNWRVLLGRPARNSACPGGTIRHPPDIRGTDEYYSLFRALRREIPEARFHEHVRHLLAASQLPVSELLFAAACYLANILMYQDSDIQPFVISSGFTATQIRYMALDLAQDLQWQILP